MIRLTRMVRPIERIRENTRQPGIKRTCVRSPGRLVSSSKSLPDRAAVVSARRLLRAAVLPVGLAAARLGETAADHVGGAEDGDVEPDLVGGQDVGPALG